MMRAEVQVPVRPIPAVLVIVLGILCLLPGCGNDGSGNKPRQIILISIDTLRADHLGCYGYQRDTSPNLDRLAASSSLFRSAYANGCWTIPSHMSILTGTMPSRHGLDRDYQALTEGRYPVLGSRIRTVAEILKDDHFATIKVGRLPDELGFGRGFSINHSIDPFRTESGFGTLQGELEKHRDRDFFIFIHTWMVHSPYAHERYLNAADKARLSEDARAAIGDFRRSVGQTKEFESFLKEHQLYNTGDCLNLYDGGIRYVDEYIGRLREYCHELGIYQNIMLVVLSDHGEHFSEHAEWLFYNSHGWNFFEELIRVPLIIKYPGRNSRRRISRPVSLISVAPTILDFYALKQPKWIQGASLLNRAGNEVVVSESVSDHLGVEKKMIRIGKYKYIITMREAAGPGRVNWKRVTRRRLFDLEADPMETRNLYDLNLEFKKIAYQMGQILKSQITSSLKDKQATKYSELRDRTVEDFRTLGYL